MNKSQQHMEQMAALVLLAFTIGFPVTGEVLRDELYGAPQPTQGHAADEQPAIETADSKARRKWQRSIRVSSSCSNVSSGCPPNNGT